MIIGIIAVIAIIIIAVIVLNKKFKFFKSGKDTGEKIEMENTSSTIHFSDDFKNKGSATIEKEHMITTILMNKEDSCVWVCPNCEVENPSSEIKCCVCNMVK